MTLGRRFLLTLMVSFLSARSHAQVPQLIHVQGRVTDNRSSLDGLGEFKFSLVSSNLTLTFWSNDGSGRAGAEPSNSVPVNVDKGVFSVMLGDTTLPHMTPVSATVFTNPGVELRIWFRAAGSALDKPFTLLLPDLRFAAVGYAMFAADVPDGSIKAAKLAPNAVGSIALAPGSVNTLHLADGAVTREKLAAGAIPPPSFPDGSVTTGKLADQAVTSVKIADRAVSDRAVADNAILTRAMANGAVTAGKIAAGAVNVNAIAPAAVNQEKLASAAVGSVQLADGAVITTKLSNSSVTAEKLAPGVALSNLVASGFSGVPPAGIVLSLEQDSPSLIQAGFSRSGSTSLAPDRWELRTGFGNYPVFHATVWTGSELIVLQTGELFSGGRYNPRRDSWQPMSTNGAPFPRYRTLVLWTGSEMILWGGISPSDNSLHADGGLYDPLRDTWRPLSGNGAPSNQNATAVWTGSEMLIWGGVNGEGVPLNSGGRYDPIRNEWKPISVIGAPRARDAHAAVWTGEEMIVWGGETRTNGDYVLLNSGGRYRTSTDTWAPTALVDAPPPLAGSPAVWTGTEMLVWGGVGQQLYTRTGARFNPVSNSWKTVTTRNAPLHRANHSVVWTGSEMIVWGGILFPDNSVSTDTGARYNPQTDEWVQLTQQSAPPPRWGHSAVWLGDGMAIIGGLNTPFDAYVLYVWKPSLSAYLYQRP